MDHLNIKKKFLLTYLIYQSSERLKAAIQNIDKDDFANIILDGCKFLAQAIVEYAYFGPGSEFCLQTSLIIQLVEKFQQVCSKLGCVDFMLPIKQLIIYKSKEQLHDATIKLLQQAWKTGDKKFHNEIHDSNRTHFASKVNKIQEEELQLRDNFIVDQIHRDLLQCSENRRGFYAVGTAHVIGSHENLKKLLKKRGWKIVNAYKTASK